MYKRIYHLTNIITKTPINNFYPHTHTHTHTHTPLNYKYKYKYKLTPHYSSLHLDLSLYSVCTLMGNTILHVVPPSAGYSSCESDIGGEPLWCGGVLPWLAPWEPCVLHRQCPHAPPSLLLQGVVVVVVVVEGLMVILNDTEKVWVIGSLLVYGSISISTLL